MTKLVQNGKVSIDPILLNKIIEPNKTTKTLDCFHKLNNNRKLNNNDKAHLMFEINWEFNHHQSISVEEKTHLEKLLTKL